MHGSIWCVSALHMYIYIYIYIHHQSKRLSSSQAGDMHIRTPTVCKVISCPIHFDKIGTNILWPKQEEGCCCNSHTQHLVVCIVAVHDYWRLSWLLACLYVCSQSNNNINKRNSQILSMFAWYHVLFIPGGSLGWASSHCEDRLMMTSNDT